MLCDLSKLNDEAESENSSTTKSALSASRLDNELFSGADKHHLLLYIEETATHEQGSKQNITLIGLVF